MAGGLAALLDDISLLARAAAANIDDVAAHAAKTSTKAVGVVVDDAAVTPKFVEGISPSRELPMIFRIARGSLFNKLIVILPLALLLSWLAPWLLNPILMLGGAFLCFEGMEKVIERLTGADSKDEAASAGNTADEDQLVKSAIATDLILSAEIMVISLNEVAHLSFGVRTAALVLVALGLTALVYGAVALLVKMDDLGLKLAAADNSGTAAFGRGLVAAMPKVLAVIGVIGTFAMLWVGGHIILHGAAELGCHAPEEFVHSLTSDHHGFLGWLITTGCSLVVGAIIGTILATAVHFSPLKRTH
ncbi:Inner membrane protein YedI [Corynebacterium ciconiae DSM 44920]|uniref:DUF808 domain-containing protein n=1 Tax=Corynebacterium ciconiae TaxID=227319 RepID=UPI000378FAE4|nr:DUF808 domain-containing protein [Corynebacterium ciconiae]WKD60843.1 Inner membrane protein YedI [Corynebacterium ciconiae DSM 44920]